MLCSVTLTCSKSIFSGCLIRFYELYFGFCLYEQYSLMADFCFLRLFFFCFWVSVELPPSFVKNFLYQVVLVTIFGHFNLQRTEK